LDSFWHQFFQEQLVLVYQWKKKGIPHRYDNDEQGVLRKPIEHSWTPTPYFAVVWHVYISIVQLSPCLSSFLWLLGTLASLHLICGLCL
jgi:hypothetical protein